MNEWSDRPNRPHRRGFVASQEFWLDAAATLVTLAVAIGVIDVMAPWF